MPSPLALPNELRTRLVDTCRELLGEKRLIVAGNRGPVEYVLTTTGDVSAQRGHGGLVTGLGAISQFCRLTWVSSAMGEADRKASSTAGGGIIISPLPGQNIAIRFIVCPRNTYHKYYNVISNPLLWFLQHQMWNSPYTPNIDAGTYDAWENGYVVVNREFADAVIAEMGRPGNSHIAMLHDYQLYLVGKMVREQVPDAILHHFVHIPWPSAVSWRLLPPTIRNAIIEGLLANDVVGFQTTRSVLDFLYTVEAFFPDAIVEPNNRLVHLGGHTTRVEAYPIAVDVPGLRRTAASSRVREFQDRLEPTLTEYTVVRVDRIDPSRNIVRGFRAFDLMLARHPELRGRVRFLCFLTPSRTRVREYQRYGEELTAMANAVNGKYGRPDWVPIEIFLENNYLLAVAGLRVYDVLLVNAVVDGMNLVAKEGPIVNTKDGVLVLSEGTGAFEQLREAALEVTPTDLEATAQALHRALTMPADERKACQETLCRLIERDDITTWLYRQFSDLLAVTKAGEVPLDLVH
ncbi:MAG: alpha,alpha-trehalose-phosphate synthase (UDP-forming) [Chloroflexota bacterium]